MMRKNYFFEQSILLMILFLVGMWIYTIVPRNDVSSMVSEVSAADAGNRTVRNNLNYLPEMSNGVDPIILLLLPPLTEYSVVVDMDVLRQAQIYVDVETLQEVTRLSVDSIAMQESGQNSQQGQQILKKLEERNLPNGLQGFRPLSTVKYRFSSGDVVYVSSTLVFSDFEQFRDSVVLGTEFVHSGKRNVYQSQNVNTQEFEGMNRLAFWDKNDHIVSVTGTFDFEILSVILEEI